MTTAILLARETRGLLIGESASPEVLRSVRSLAARDPSVLSAGRPVSIHYGPDFVVLNLELAFRSNVSAEEAAATIGRLEHAIQQDHPEIKRISIEAQSMAAKVPPRSASTGSRPRGGGAASDA